jgi:hypothetical protein
LTGLPLNIKNKKMFTLQQIKAAHAKVKSGADFPAYVQEIKQLGLLYYDFLVKNGQTEYHGTNGFQVNSDAIYPEKQFQFSPHQSPFSRSLPDISRAKAIFNFLSAGGRCGGEKMGGRYPGHDVYLLRSGRQHHGCRAYPGKWLLNAAFVISKPAANLFFLSGY